MNVGGHRRRFQSALARRASKHICCIAGDTAPRAVTSSRGQLFVLCRLWPAWCDANLPRNKLYFMKCLRSFLRRIGARSTACRAAGLWSRNFYGSKRQYKRRYGRPGTRRRYYGCSRRWRAALRPGRASFAPAGMSNMAYVMASAVPLFCHVPVSAKSMLRQHRAKPQ